MNRKSGAAPAFSRIHDPASEVNDHGGHQRAALMRQLQDVGRQTLSPVDFLTNALERWVAFVIMPLFALSNAGVALDHRTLSNPEAQGVAVAVGLGLLLGKPVGVSLFSWIAVRSGIAALPRGVNWTSLFATGALAGIGFTVALFVTDPVYQKVVIGAAVWYGLGLLWFAIHARRKLVLAPEESFALSAHDRQDDT